MSTPANEIMRRWNKLHPDVTMNLTLQEQWALQDLINEEVAALIARIERLEQSWQPIETAPHEQKVLVGWWHNDEWMSEAAMASHGWRRNGISTMSCHGQATHWQPLPPPPTAALLAPSQTDKDAR